MRPAPFRWASAEQFHVTLAFLADVEERRIDDLAERLGRAAAASVPRSRRAIAGGGAFPNAARARVLWAGPRPRRARPHRARPAGDRLPGRGATAPASPSTGSGSGRT